MSRENKTDLPKEIRIKQKDKGNQLQCLKVVARIGFTRFLHSDWIERHRTLISVVYTKDDSIVPTATAEAWPYTFDKFAEKI